MTVIDEPTDEGPANYEERSKIYRAGTVNHQRGKDFFSRKKVFPDIFFPVSEYRKIFHSSLFE